MTKRERVLQVLVCVMCGACTAFSVFCPKEASSAAYAALTLCAKSVVPSLFLFMAAAKIFMKSGGAKLFSRLTGGACEKIFNISESGAAAVFLGMISGYPAGAFILADNISRGKTDIYEAQSILPFITAASPAFLIGAVGNSLFSSAGYGAVMLICQTISALILLLATRKSRNPFHGTSEHKEDDADFSFTNVISSSIKESGVAVVSVCSFVTFFCVFAEMTVYFLPESAKLAKTLAIGIMEISGGFAALADGSRSFFEKYFLGGAILGFSGVSVFMQSASALAESGISMKKYAAGKAVQSLLCGTLAVVFGFVYEKGFPTLFFKLFGIDAPKLLSAAEFTVIFASVFACVAVFLAALIKILSFFSKNEKILKKLWKKIVR